MKTTNKFCVTGLLLMLSFFLFSSFLCDKDDEDLCGGSTSWEITHQSGDFMYYHDYEYNEVWFEADNALIGYCKNQKVVISGLIKCSDMFCTGAYTWKIVIKCKNYTVKTLEPVCAGGQCPFEYTLPTSVLADYDGGIIKTYIRAFVDYHQGADEDIKIFWSEISHVTVKYDYHEDE